MISKYFLWKKGHIVGRIAAPKDVSILVPRTCEYVMSRGKGDSELQMQSKLLIADLKMKR